MTHIVRRRLTRRMLLTDFGAAVLGVVVLGACGGSSSSDSAGETSPSDEPPATQPPATEPGATDAPVVTATTDASVAALRFQHVGINSVSAFVLLRGNEAAVVDTGNPGSGPLILDGLAALGADWSNVKHVVLTHLHGDHVGGLGDVLAESSAVTVYAGEADIGGIQSAQPIVGVGDGDEVLGLGVLGTPGHTAGSISLFDTETGLLIAGDAITGDGAGTLLGPNPRFTPDMDEALASVAKLATLDAKIAGFGHVGPPVESDVMAQLAAIVAG